jgi:hypothetical protein
MTDDPLASSSPLETTRPLCSVPEQPPLGVIEEVHGPVIDILCSRLPPLHRAVYFCVAAGQIDRSSSMAGELA